MENLGTLRISVIYNIFATLIIVGLGVYIIMHRGPLSPKPEIVTHTDTIIRYEPYKPLEPYKRVLLPERVVEYRPIIIMDNSELSKLQLKLIADSLIIEGLKDTIKIHQNYIKSFPTSPKLVNLDLTRNDLTLSLLNIDGITEEYQYPIYLNSYRYRWVDGDFTYKKDKFYPHTRGISIYSGMCISTQYLIPMVDMRLEKQWSRIRVYSNTSIGLFKPKMSEVKIGIEYNIK